MMHGLAAIIMITLMLGSIPAMYYAGYAGVLFYLLCLLMLCLLLELIKLT